MQEAADPWFLNFSTARAVYVATASSNSASDSTGLPKDLAVMMPFFGLGSVSRDARDPSQLEHRALDSDRETLANPVFIGVFEIFGGKDTAACLQAVCIA